MLTIHAKVDGSLDLGMMIGWFDMAAIESEQHSSKIIFYLVVIPIAIEAI